MSRMPHTIDTTDWSDDEIAQVIAQAVYTGHEVAEDIDTLTISKPKPRRAPKPKPRFFQ